MAYFIQQRMILQYKREIAWVYLAIVLSLASKQWQTHLCNLYLIVLIAYSNFIADPPIIASAMPIVVPTNGQFLTVTGAHFTPSQLSAVVDGSPAPMYLLLNYCDRIRFDLFVELIPQTWKR